MDTSENVEISDMDSVSIISDKSEGNEKISKSLDDTYPDEREERLSKTDSDDSFVMVKNNGDANDTNANLEKNITNDVSTFDPITPIEQSDKFMLDVLDEERTNRIDASIEINDSAELLDPAKEVVSLDDDNLLDEIHRGDFKSSSPEPGPGVGAEHTVQGIHIQSLDDSGELLEQKHYEEQEEEHLEEIELRRESEQSQEGEENSVGYDEPIEIDDDDDEEEEEEVDEDEDEMDDEVDDEDNEPGAEIESVELDDESDFSNDESIDREGDEDNDDIRSVSDESVEELIIKKPTIKIARERVIKKQITSKRKSSSLKFRDKMRKLSIKRLLFPKGKPRMHLEQPSDTIKGSTEHSNGNNICQSFPPLGISRTISTGTKNVDEMVQMLPNENDVEDDSDDVCIIEDSPVKFNGNCEKKDERMIVEHKIKEELIEAAEEKVHEIIEENINNETEHEDHVKEELVTNISDPTPMECNAIVSENVPKTTDLNTAETVPTIQDVTEEVKEEVTTNNIKPNNKRSRSSTPVEDVQPTKRLRTELEQSYVGHNKLLQDYIDKTSNNSADEIKNHVDSLLGEIQQLQDMAMTKEQEWNSILHLKKVKEEIVHRLRRKKSVMEIMSTKIGPDYTITIPLEKQPSLSQKITTENRNSILVNNASSNNSSNSYENSGSQTTKSILNRVAMNTSDLAKEKANTTKIHRNILPKPEHSGRSSPNIPNYINSLGAVELQHIHQQQQQQQQRTQQQLIEQQQLIHQHQKNNAAITELLNGHHQTQIGRQGAFKDVKSIIEDFRQKNPESIPRRGRRMKNSHDSAVTSSRTGLNTEGILAQQSVESRMSELGLLLTKMDGSSRPSSADSSPGNSNLAPNVNNNISTANANASFNEMLMQYAKYNERLSGPSEILTSTPIIKQQTGNYPEVTLHPVSSQANASHHQNDSSQSNSLLHGILTKNTRPSSGYNAYSPTLARLLTAPERISTLPNNYHLPSSQVQPLKAKPGGINLTKPRSEITITPVMATPANIHQAILQQQLQRHHDSRMKAAMIDDEADDSADRLVIDEGEMHNEQNVAIGGPEFHENEVPDCQGCKTREAQFVCAGCGSQWYCSRVCQVTAWDEHSEVCTG